MSGSYIVVFKDHATQDQIDDYINNLNSNGGELKHKYGTVLKGFAAKIPDSFLTNLQSDDLIDYIEKDGVVTTQ